MLACVYVCQGSVVCGLGCMSGGGGVSGWVAACVWVRRWGVAACVYSMCMLYTHAAYIAVYAMYTCSICLYVCIYMCVG